MAKTKIFVSYDYKHDSNVKKDLLTQSKLADSPFSVTDWSLNEKVPNWQQSAINKIRTCDVFIVLLTENAHQSTGVLYEVKQATKYQVPRFQLRQQKHNTKKIPNAGPCVEWTWDNLKEYIVKKHPSK